MADRENEATAAPPGASLYLSPHFTRRELTRSETALRMGLVNEPNAAQWAWLEILARDLLEPVRRILGVPLHVNSGFRSPAVNAAVGGRMMSVHQYGRAADVYPVGLDLETAMEQIAATAHLLPLDQAIAEFSEWLHLSIPGSGAEPRRQLLCATRTAAGAISYEPWLALEVA